MIHRWNSDLICDQKSTSNPRANSLNSGNILSRQCRSKTFFMVFKLGLTQLLENCRWAHGTRKLVLRWSLVGSTDRCGYCSIRHTGSVRCITLGTQNHTQYWCHYLRGTSGAKVQPLNRQQNMDTRCLRQCNGHGKSHEFGSAIFLRTLKTVLDCAAMCKERRRVIRGPNQYSN